LGGTSRFTWSKDHNLEYFWPEKYLPAEPEIRYARLLSFGYDANFKAAGPTPITGIADFATSLLYSMKFAKGQALEELDLGQVGFPAHQTHLEMEPLLTNLLSRDPSFSLPTPWVDLLSSRLVSSPEYPGKDWFTKHVPRAGLSSWSE
jgi:hypothetical protein